MASCSTSTSRWERPGQANNVILLVEADEEFRYALAEILRDDGHEVLEYAAAADVPARQLARATVLITHCRMPSADALAFADRFHAAHPRAAVIATTSYSTPYLESEIADRPYMRLVRKLIDYAELEPLLEASKPDIVEDAHAPVSAPL